MIYFLSEFKKSSNCEIQEAKQFPSCDFFAVPKQPSIEATIYIDNAFVSSCLISPFNTALVKTFSKVFSNFKYTFLNTF